MTEPAANTFDVVRTGTLLRALRPWAKPAMPSRFLPDDLWQDLEAIAAKQRAEHGELMRLARKHERSPDSLKAHVYAIRRGYRPQYRGPKA